MVSSPLTKRFWNVQSFGYFLGGVDAAAVCKWHYLKKILYTLSNARNTTLKLTKNSFLTLSTPFSLARVYGLLSSFLAARNIL